MWDFFGKALAMIWPGLSLQAQRRVGATILALGLIALVGFALLPWASIYRDMFPSLASAPITASNNSGGQNGTVVNNGTIINGPILPPTNGAPDFPPRPDVGTNPPVAISKSVPNSPPPANCKGTGILIDHGQFGTANGNTINNANCGIVLSHTKHVSANKNKISN